MDERSVVCIGRFRALVDDFTINMMTTPGTGLGRGLINEQLNGDTHAPPNVRYRGKADMVRTRQYVRF